MLNGASSEGAGVIVESTFDVVAAIVIGLCYSWKIALIGIGCVPFMVAGAYIGAKF